MRSTPPPPGVAPNATGLESVTTSSWNDSTSSPTTGELRHRRIASWYPGHRHRSCHHRQHVLFPVVVAQVRQDAHDDRCSSAAEQSSTFRLLKFMTSFQNLRLHRFRHEQVAQATTSGVLRVVASENTMPRRLGMAVNQKSITNEYQPTSFTDI